MRKTESVGVVFLVAVSTAITTGVALWLLQPLNGTTASLAVVIGMIPYTYFVVRYSSIFDYPEFYQEEGPVRVAGWILAAILVTGIPAVVLGAVLSYVFSPTGLLPIATVTVLTALLPFLFAWRLVVVRWNPEYRTDQDAQPS